MFTGYTKVLAMQLYKCFFILNIVRAVCLACLLLMLRLRRRLHLPEIKLHLRKYSYHTHTQTYRAPNEVKDDIVVNMYISHTHTLQLTVYNFYVAFFFFVFFIFISCVSNVYSILSLPLSLSFFLVDRDQKRPRKWVLQYQKKTHPEPCDKASNHLDVRRF